MADVYAFPARLRSVEPQPQRRPVLVHSGEPIPSPPSRFMPAETLGAIYIGTVRYDAEQAQKLMDLFQREEAWPLHAAISAAIDGLTPEPPQAA